MTDWASAMVYRVSGLTAGYRRIRGVQPRSWEEVHSKVGNMTGEGGSEEESRWCRRQLVWRCAQLVRRGEKALRSAVSARGEVASSHQVTNGRDGEDTFGYRCWPVTGGDVRSQGRRHQLDHPRSGRRLDLRARGESARPRAAMRVDSSKFRSG